MNKKLLVSMLMVSAIFMTACGGGTTEKSDDNENGEDTEKVEVPATLACAEGMSEYQVTGTPIQFCYNPAWGEVVVEPQTVEVGSVTKVSFASGQGPKIGYQSTDAKTDFCFECLNVTAPEEQLQGEVAEQLKDVDPTKLKIRKGDVFGVRSVRVNDGTNVTYFVPNAFEGYNMSISSPQEAAAELDDFIYEMIL